MDILMGQFAEEMLPSMKEEDLLYFGQLLDHSDPDLYDWLSGRKSAEGVEPQHLLQLLKARYVRSD